MWLRNTARRFLRQTGFDLVRYANLPTSRRIQLISSHRINLILDVGANTGQYAMHMRQLGYKGRIVSFEPVTSAYNVLAKYASHDGLWNTVNIALGDYDGKAQINIAGNSVSSSILEILPVHVHAAPTSAYVSKEEITVRRIDSIIDEYYHVGERLFLKTDTQGYEQKVIEGATDSLDHIIGIQVEMSLVPLYKGEMSLSEMTTLLSHKGYALMSIEPGFRNLSTGQLLQVDGIFFRP